MPSALWLTTDLKGHCPIAIMFGLRLSIKSICFCQMQERVLSSFVHAFSSHTLSNSATTWKHHRADFGITNISIEAGVHLLIRRRSIDNHLLDVTIPISNGETRSRGALRMRLPPWLRAITDNDSRLHKLVQRNAVWRVVTLLRIIEPPNGTICNAEVFRASRGQRRRKPLLPCF